MLLIIRHLKSYLIFFGFVIAQPPISVEGMLDWAIRKERTGFGACPVLDTGVNPPKAEDNDNHWNRVRYE